MILRIDEDLLPTISARSDVIDPVGDLDACRSWHEWNVGPSPRSDASAVPFSSKLSTFLDMSGVRPRT